MAPQNPASILYNSTGTAPVTTISDGSALRLQVQTQNVSSFSPTPANNIQTLLLNGSSSNMRVTGTLATPITFKFSANATRNITITSIMTVLSAGQIVTNGTYLGQAGAALTNGILYQVTQTGTTNQLGPLIKINEDFLSLAGERCFDVSGAYAFGVINLGCNAALVAGSTDSVSVVIRDNLNANQFTYLVAYAVGYYTS